MNPSPDPPGARRELFWRAMAAVLITLGLYLLPAIVVILDEAVFGTNWIGRHMSGSLGRLFCEVYPWVCAMFGG